MKCRRRLILSLTVCAAAALGIALCAAVRLSAQDANNQQQEEGQAESKKRKGDAFAPEMNTNTAADRDLRVARDLAAAGAYGEAAQRYVDLLTTHPDAMSPADEHLHLPAWRIVIEDVLAWPAEGQEAYRDTVAADARQQWTLARRKADLRSVERVAHTWFLSDVGDDAAVALGDRLREAGMPALALYYYKLVLDKHPTCDIPRQQVVMRAALAARAAGVAEMADELTAAMDDATVRTDVDAPEQPAAPWVRAQPLPTTDAAGPSAGRGLYSTAAPVNPAAVIWQDEFIRPGDTQSQQMRFQITHMNRSGVATSPPIIPTVRGDAVYAARLHTAWALDARTGELLWRHDTRKDSPAPLPAREFQSRQPLVVGDVVYAPLEEPSSNNNQNVWMFNQGQGGMHTSLYALSAASGLVLWNWDPRQAKLEYGELSVDGMPVVSGDTLVVALGSPGTFYGEVYTAALDRHSGKLLWSQPVLGYSAAYIGQQNQWNFSSRNVSASVAVRDGLVLTNALGTTAAQSLLSGRLLWARTMQDMRQIPFGETEGHADAEGRLVNGAYLARLPRVLVDGGLVATGCVLSPQLEAYHWWDGSMAWQRPADGATYLVALDGHRGVAWGSKVLTFDMATGESPWPAADLGEPATAEPALAGDKLLVPTTSGIVCVNLATGEIETRSKLPPGFTSGNLAVGRSGMLVTSDSDIVSYLDWETARKQFTEEAAARPEDARPWMTLGAAALRLDKTTEGLAYLDKALDRTPNGDAAVELYQIYEDYYRESLNRLDDKLVNMLADRMQTSALDPDSVCRQALLRAEVLTDRDARAAVAALQEILDGPAMRHVQVSFPDGPGISGILAEQAVARLIERHGRSVYAPWDERASKAREAARRAGDYDALIEVACRWPNSLAARTALDDALALTLTRDDLTEANRLLARLVNLTGEGRQRNRYRALAIQVAERLDLKTQAELQAMSLAARALPDDIVPSLDGGRVRVGDLTAAAPQGLVSKHYEGLPEMPKSPYRLAWRLELDSDDLVQLAPVTPGTGVMAGRRFRSTTTADGEALLLANKSLVTAVSRSDGHRIWTFNIETPPGQRSSSRVWATRNAIYLVDRGNIGMIDPRDGTFRWRVALQPQYRRAGSSSPETVTGALRYGDAGFADGTASVPTRLIEFDDVLAIAAGNSLYMLDARDGYAVRTVSYAQGECYGGLQVLGRKAWGVPTQPQHMRQRVLVWDLATGDLEREIPTSEHLMPAGGPSPGDRYWPIFENAMRKITVFDAVEGTVGPMITIGDGQRRQFYQRIAMATDDMLVLIHPSEGLAAVDRNSGELLWVYECGAKRNIQFCKVDDERVLVWGDFCGVAMVRISDGHELWRIAETGWQQTGVTQLLADGFMMTTRRKTDDGTTTYQAVHDLETGARTFLLERSDGSSVGAVYVDAKGMLVRGGPKDPLEFWVSDEQGTWKDRSPDDPPPDAPPSDEPAAEDNGNGADPNAAPGPANNAAGLGNAVRVRVRIQGGAGEVEVEAED